MIFELISLIFRKADQFFDIPCSHAYAISQL